MLHRKALTLDTQQNRLRTHTLLLCQLHNRLDNSERAPCAAQRAVCNDVDAFLLTKLCDFALWEPGVELNLIDSRDNFGDW